MVYYTYILQSLKDGRFYVGQTQHLAQRFSEHNAGKSSYTAKFTPWNLLWYKEFNNRKEAMLLEKQLKKFKSRVKVIDFMRTNLQVLGSENLQISNLIDFRESS